MQYFGSSSFVPCVVLTDLNMARYRDVAAFKKALARAPLDNREDFLHTVKHAHIEDPTPFPNEASALAITFAQFFDLVDSSRQCDGCGSEYVMTHQWLKDNVDGKPGLIMRWRAPMVQTL